ncbi:MAG: hypothetical protein VX294_03410 [Candidatus Latescibacterota bacterium]|nr:hypothetical protein [Candidatus Latescibacterota bacterium]
MENNQVRSSRLQVQDEELGAIKDMLRIEIDGDWDEEMIGTAFDNLESLLCGDSSNEDPTARSRRPVPQSRRRRRR